MVKSKHWTTESLADFRYFVASDFVTQIQSALESKNLPQSYLADQMKVTEGRVSQIFNNPGNLTLNTMIQCVRSLDLKLTVVTYDDGDKGYLRGPIFSEVFRTCWEMFEKPLDNWGIESQAMNLISKGWANESAQALVVPSPKSEAKTGCVLGGQDKTENMKESHKGISAEASDYALAA